MKFLSIILLIILILLGIVLHRSDYNKRLKPKLLQQANKVLQENNFKNVNVTLDHLDATLTGTAVSVERRKEAEKLVDDLDGVRVPATYKNSKGELVGNLIKIPGNFLMLIDNKKINAEGLIPNNAKEELDNLNKVITTAGYELDSSKVKLKDNVLPESLGPLFLPNFTKILKKYFLTAGNKKLEIRDRNLKISGNAVYGNSRGWFQDTKNLITEFEGWKITNNLSLLPSIFHIPGYTKESNISAENYKSLSQILADTNIYFDTGSSDVKETELPKIDALAVAMKEAGDEVKYVIGGHTDATGDYQANIKLSKQRAESVIKLLEEREVNVENLELVSFGASQLVGSNSTEQSKKLSRRVEILIK